uniref:acyl-CoA dehydrogenase n=1 Tax=Rhodoblastus sp. TaxID=1962975 RepID=UPI003F981A14
VMSFGDKGGALGYLVGEPNRGLEYMFTMMNHARLNVGLEGVAIAERAYQQARDYASQRVQGRPIGAQAGAPIAFHPDVKRMLLDMKSRVEAMRALAYYAASQMDVAHLSPDAAEAKKAQARVDLLIPVVKGWCTENSIDIASTGVQVHGGMGFIEETGAAQHFRDARITTIYEGTTAIQANDLVGRKIARDGGAAARDLIAEIEVTMAASAGIPEVAALAKALSEPLAHFADSVEWIVKNNPAAPARTAAAAVPMLHLAGIVVGFWLLVKQASVAAQGLSAGEGDPAFLKGKLAYARFFATQILPRTQALFRAITQGSEDVESFDPALLAG